MKFGPNTGKIICCGFGFLTLFFSYNTLQNLTTQIFEQLAYDRLGFYTLASVYISTCVTNLLCSPLVKYLGSKNSLIFGGVLDTFLVAAYIIPGFCANLEGGSDWAICGYPAVATIFISASIIFGVGCSVLWIGEGMFLGECSVNDNAETLQGYFWIILQSSQILGNLFGSLILNSRKAKLVFFIALTVIAGFTAVIFLFMKTPNNNIETVRTYGTSDEISELKHIPANEEVKSTNKDVPKEEITSSRSNNSPTILDNILATFKLMVTLKMMSLIFYIIYAGIIICYFAGVLPLTIKDKLSGIGDDIYVNRRTVTTMIFFGVADGAGGYIFGQLSTKYGKRIGLINMFIVGTITMIVTFFLTYYTEFHWYWYFLGALWGLTDGSVNPVLTAILATEFEDTSIAFCVSGFVRNLFSFLGFIVGAQLRNSEPIYMMIIVESVCLIGFLTSFAFPLSEQKVIKNNIKDEIKDNDKEKADMEQNATNFSE